MPVQLKAVVRYDFVVALEANPDDPAQQQRIYAKSTVWRLDASEALGTKLAATDEKLLKAMIFAQEGIWIDALDEVSQLIAKHPNYLPLRRQRAELLRQGGFLVTITPREDDTFAEQLDLITP